MDANTHTFDIQSHAHERDLALSHLSDVEDNLTDYLGSDGASLDSDAYADLRRAARDAADKADAAFLALARERRRVFAAWHDARAGDHVTTADGVSGRITLKGSISGCADTGTEERRFKVLSIVSLVRDGEAHA